MHQSVKNIIDLYDNVKQKIEELNFKNYNPQIIAVSKTFSMDSIAPLINHGHIHFGENKVQEAENKWKEEKLKNPNIKLHMIGKLQSNKVKQAVRIFDYIHSIDNVRLAKKISEEQLKQKRNVKVFLQVNIGDEIQKSGTKLSNLDELVDECKKLKLNVIGLMCLPPFGEPVSKYFSLIKKKNDDFKFNDLSIGMSGDYIEALKYKTSFLRIGTKIFGERIKKF